MALRAVQELDRYQGLVANYAAADAAGDRAPQGEGVFLHVKSNDTSTGAAARNVTVDIPGRAAGTQEIPERAFSVPAVGERFIALDNPEYQQADGTVRWTYQTVTGVTMAVIHSQDPS